MRLLLLERAFNCVFFKVHLLSHRCSQGHLEHEGDAFRFQRLRFQGTFFLFSCLLGGLDSNLPED